MEGLKGLGKSRKYKRLTTLSGGHGRKAQPFTSELGNPSQDFVDQEAQRIRSLLNDEPLARKVESLKQSNPNGSLPELVTLEWLIREQVRYTYQGGLFGAKTAKGGLLPDFVIDAGGGDAIVWQVQGEYWHSRQAQHGQNDFANNLRMLGQVIEGLRISKVVELWETDIYKKRPLIFQAAMAGMGLR